jgi:cytochrome c biogenesis protein CcmG, thiol:disulfide interchange protein DsbE
MTRTVLMRGLYILPIVAMAALAIAFYASLSGPPPDELPSALIGKPAPAVALPALYANATPFTSADLKAGHVTVVNIWASWCVPCRVEGPALQALAREKGVVLYGMVWKDSADKARSYLADTGNPYARIDLDQGGQEGIDWGITGVPETFVIDGRGIVRLRYPAPLVGDALESTILPAIRQAEADS